MNEQDMQGTIRSAGRQTATNNGLEAISRATSANQRPRSAQQEAGRVARSFQAVAGVYIPAAHHPCGLSGTQPNASRGRYIKFSLFRQVVGSILCSLWASEAGFMQPCVTTPRTAQEDPFLRSCHCPRMTRLGNSGSAFLCLRSRNRTWRAPKRCTQAIQHASGPLPNKIALQGDSNREAL